MKVTFLADVVSTGSTYTPVQSLTTRVYCVPYTCICGICTQPQASLSISIQLYVVGHCSQYCRCTTYAVPRTAYSVLHTSHPVPSVLYVTYSRCTHSRVLIIALLHKFRTYLYQGYRIRLQGYALWICCTHYTHICSLSQATPYKTYRFEANDLYQLEYRLIHLGISQYYDQTSSR